MGHKFIHRLRDLSDDEIMQRLRELKMERFKVAGAFSVEMPPLTSRNKPNTALMMNIDRDIARCLTVLTERRIKNENAERFK